MTKHIYIDDYGTFLGKTSARLTISQSGQLLQEIALSRIRSINILKGGISLSSDLIEACSLRGIKIFFLDFKNVAHTSLSSTASHAVANVRRAQFLTIESDYAKEIARALILGKLKNQRATLQYFYKYQKNTDKQSQKLDIAIIKIKDVIESLKTIELKNRIDWLGIVMGKEGGVASIYFDAIGSELLNDLNFSNRIGRGADDIVNSALNYGYAILTSFVWQSVINAGLEPFAGVLHTNRPGKPSLVLDIIEEYRAWVVDRNIIKLKSHLKDKKSLDTVIKKKIIEEINNTMNKKYLYNGKNLSLQGIMQRQVYKLTGAFMQQNHYKSYIFKW
ncbi:MAG: CRISPR-associated endonuclease Cas1 [Sulfurimonas sp.]|uniref:CRISPR-associated endonuclease Cas1 n=1 Tax=Sulfurimonas sp. TaxID=2022749 RepID=UPI002607A1B2|nr:CRISPR-associated endonuclease Cas1 [Sulfurimonas sp.]MDD2652862.1 CRISPR-associated endonuclease Cas1 [Sulfurimonas sp.]MDD3450907.1 CRISPR-associated endonuclease Cas1 [Sulfurimonas sp.]